MIVNLFFDDIPSSLCLEGDLALDTEAMGLTISRDKLCLLQISTGNQEVYLVQFENNYDAPNLKKLLSNAKTTKIFHFARFDLAIIKHYLGIEIQNVFCTQIASKMARTYTDSHGLKDLCRELLHENISKEQRSSDWGKKPLSKEQQQYAAIDVLHLHKLRLILTDMLIRESRMEVAKKVFSFLNTRVELDLLGWQDVDIFAHTGIRKSLC
jgi:ribonuclease D